MSAQHLYIPPVDSWELLGKQKASIDTEKYTSPRVDCFGTLTERTDLLATSGGVVTNPTNIELLIQRPITTSIIAGILYYGYYLWANRIPVEDVAFSYDAVVNRGGNSVIIDVYCTIFSYLINISLWTSLS